MLGKGYHMNSSATHNEFECLVNEIAREMRSNTFVFIPSANARYLEKHSLFGPEVKSAFPSARPEIKAAGNCIAADLNTAAVFHLMRVAEIGLRALARHLRVTIPRLPLEYAEWGQIIQRINDKIALRIPKSRGRRKSEALQYYHGLLGELDAFKDVWRNNVMHTRESYDQDLAVKVYGHVNEFMNRLAAKVRE